MQDDLDDHPFHAEAEALPEQRVLEQQDPEVLQAGEPVVPGLGDVVVLQAVIDHAAHRVDEEPEHRDHRRGDQHIGGARRPCDTHGRDSLARAEGDAGGRRPTWLALNAWKTGHCNRLHETFPSLAGNVKGSISGRVSGLDIDATVCINFPVAATIRDVAQASGVHVSTVSRTFSAPHLVNPETRNRVLAAAEDLGYRPNRAARALTTGRTHNLGLIVADIANPFFSHLIKGAQAHARTRDYHVFVADTDEDPSVEEELIQTLAKQVDGVLLCSPRLSNRVIEKLHEDVPFVVVNRRMKGMSNVLMDVGSGAREAIAHLVSLGHRRIALLAGPAGSWTSKEITEAARSVPGIDLTVLGPNSPTEHGGLALAEPVASLEVTGVLAYNDLMAIGLVEGLTSLGIEVPADVSVVGDRRHRGRAGEPPQADHGRHARRGRRPHRRRPAAPARRRTGHPRRSPPWPPT